MSDEHRKIIKFDEGWFREDQLTDQQRLMLDLPKSPQSVMSFAPRDPGQSPMRRLANRARAVVLNVRLFLVYLRTGWGPF